MGLLSAFISKYHEKELGEDIKKDIELLEKLLKIYESKTDSIKKIVPLWEGQSTSGIGETERIISEIPKQNKEIQLLITKILKEERLTNLIKQLVQIEIKKYDLSSTKRAVRNHLQSINDYFLQIMDNIKFLKKVLLSQSLYLSEKKGFIAGKISEDLKQHAPFYQMLKNEADINRRIKQNVIFISRETQDFLMLATKPIDLSSLKAEDLTNPSGINFEQFYNDVYIPNFPDPDERDSKEFIQEYLHPAYQAGHMKNNRCHTHLLVAKIKEEVVGGFIFEFIGCENDICFGASWFLVVAKEARKKGIGTFLVNKAVEILKRDAKVLGYSHLYGIFNEVNAVSKMTPKEIEIDIRDSMDPAVRERFWERRGYYVMDFNYAQPPCLKEGAKPVTYLHLRVYPVDPEWIAQKSAPSRIFETILYNFLKNGVPVPKPEKDATSMRMMNEIRSKERIRIFM